MGHTTQVRVNPLDYTSQNKVNPLGKAMDHTHRDRVSPLDKVIIDHTPQEMTTQCNLLVLDTADHTLLDRIL